MDKQSEEKSKILIVDDTPENIRALHEILKSNYDVYFATHGEQAIELCITSNIDLILLDVLMPNMSGFVVCEALKANPKTDHIPVIFVTGLNEPSDEAYGFSVGAVDYITKPVSAPIVQARVKTQLDLTRALKIKEEQNAKLLTLNEEKNRLLGMAAHDLRNPIGNVWSCSNILLEKVPKENPAYRFITNINRTSSKMLQLLNSLLDFSAIESGSFEIQLSHVSLTDLLNEQIDLVTLQAESKNISIIRDLHPNQWLNLDPIRLSQVISNLISNALKFSHSGSKIYINSGYENEMAFFSVKDEGPGISEKEQKLLFGHFQKLTPRPTAGEQSSGLGLAIAKRIVDAHHGIIEFQSQLGQGSTFKITLPTDIPIYSNKKS